MGYEYTLLCIGRGRAMTDNRMIIDETQRAELEFWRNAMRLNTCIPAIIDSFDATTQRVSATPAIMAKHVTMDQKVEYIPYPKITNIPLAIIKSAGLKFTYPVVAGQNCTLIFSQRSIDNFLIEGGIQRPFDTNTPSLTQIRCMDMTDAMCFPGVITDKETITDYATDAIEIRSTDGTTKVSVKENSLKFLQGNASIELSGGNITMTGATIDITGTTAVNINSPATMIDEKEFLTHIHSGGTGSSGNTGGVV